MMYQPATSIADHLHRIPDAGLLHQPGIMFQVVPLQVGIPNRALATLAINQPHPDPQPKLPITYIPINRAMFISRILPVTGNNEIIVPGNPHPPAGNLQLQIWISRARCATGVTCAPIRLCNPGRPQEAIQGVVIQVVRVEDTQVAVQEEAVEDRYRKKL